MLNNSTGKQTDHTNKRRIVTDDNSSNFIRTNFEDVIIEDGHTVPVWENFYIYRAKDNFSIWRTGSLWMD